MRHTIAMLGGALTLVCALGTPARAQESAQPWLTQHVAAPSNALELKLGTGYTQGFGNVAPGRNMTDVVGEGIGASMEVDYRLSHPWSIGVEGQYQEFSAQQNSAARGVATNLGVTYHFLPTLRSDPWVRLGTGYRWLWENDAPGQQGISMLRHGFDILTAKIGYDIRASEDVAFAPVIGADLNTFVWEYPSNDGNRSMNTAEVATFVYAGLQGRFDIGGERGGVQVARYVPPEPKGVTEPQPQTPIAPPPPAQEMEPASPSLAISEEVMKACKVNLAAIEKAPKFDFDKSDLKPADFGVLQQIADCFTTGPLKDMPIKLVGRADPRGSVEYNQALGLRRASEVAAFLVQHGMDPGRIDQTSRGKLDAVGSDETTWAIDRRVDILESH